MSIHCKEMFILSSIASETGYSLEMAQSVHRILSLQLTVIENVDIQSKRH